MIILRFNHPLTQEQRYRIREELNDAIERNQVVIVVDNSVEVFTDDSDVIKLEGLET